MTGRPLFRAPEDTVLACQRRAAQLGEAFGFIERTRMAGLPLLHPGLRVQAVGFEPMDDGSALGVLLTPWFMNLVRFPLEACASEEGVGRARSMQLGGEPLHFIGAFEAGFGAYHACSLFSPMFEFADQPAALATAQAVLDILRPACVAAAPPARRHFLFGRSAHRT